VMEPIHTRIVSALGRFWLLLLCSLFIVHRPLPIVSAQPPVPHDEEEDGISYENCVTCHRTGEDGAPLLAADHAQHENVDCRACHATSGMLPPNISHPVAGWEDCRGCHERWDGKDITIPSLADSDFDHTIYESDTCLSCHVVATSYYDEMPLVACGVCHPKSTAVETVHNGPERWVDCVDCHETAGSYPHDPERIQSRNEDCLACHYDRQGHWTSAVPDERYSLTDHVAQGDPHAWADCSTCHLEIATVERNPATNRIQVVLPEVEEGVPPDTPELALVGRAVDCQRCHVADNTVAAPATELPPRSVLCLACHDAALVVQDGFSWAGIGIFGLGMLVAASVWLRGSIGGRQDLSLPARAWRILAAVLDLLTTPRLFVLVRSFIVDGILHVRLFRKSKLHWLTHASMFLSMTARMALGIFTWIMAWLAPTASLTQGLVNRSSPAVALAYDALGLLVILGACLAIVRRYAFKDKQLITGGQDTVAVALLGGIFLMGFVVEGARILTTNLQPGVAAFSFAGYLASLALGLIPLNWGTAYGWLWYVHAGLVAALVAYLPFSKFMHVLIGPLVAAFNSALKARVA
jgi:nitrate reductase gamma subunit